MVHLWERNYNIEIYTANMTFKSVDQFTDFIGSGVLGTDLLIGWYWTPSLKTIQ